MNKEEIEAEQFLQSLNPNNYAKTEVLTGMDEVELMKMTKDERSIATNDRLIAASNRLLFERIENSDQSLKLSEIISAKDTAFKQNQLLQGKATANVNINVNDLQEKSPDELILLLDSLNT